MWISNYLRNAWSREISDCTRVKYCVSYTSGVGCRYYDGCNPVDRIIMIIPFGDVRHTYCTKARVDI